MSEFERSDGTGARADARESQLPEDFSEDEAAFAQQMQGLFALQSEELPPWYVQSLLEGDRFPIPNQSFEQRIIAQVLDSLCVGPPGAADPETGTLPTTLVKSAPAAELPLAGVMPFPVPHCPSSTASVSSTTYSRCTRWPSVVRRVQARALSAYQNVNHPLAGFLILPMVLAVVFAAPSIVGGLQAIWGGTGEVRINGAPLVPASLFPTTAPDATDPAIDFNLGMPLFWPGPIAHQYAYEGTQLEPPTEWSRGAIVDLHYCFLHTSLGSGTLDIHEFEVGAAYSAVLQVVESGYVTSVTLSTGEPAVYVNGMWKQRLLDHTLTSVWQSGARSLLILKRQGVVIWMVGDPRDRLTTQMMASIAAQLTPVSRQALMRNYRGIWLASKLLVVAVNFPLLTEWYLLVPAGILPAGGIGQFVFFGSGMATGSSPGG